MQDQRKKGYMFCYKEIGSIDELVLYCLKVDLD